LSDRAYLLLDRLARTFEETPAVDDLSLTVEEHEIVTLLGPSGCGKTTTLRMIAGFERPDSGRVVLAGRDVTGLPPQKRGFGMVFQHYALFPHLSVGGNVAFGLEAARLQRGETEDRVARALALVRLPDTQSRSVGSLSGGQQQRVALARALAPEPRVLLLDEPLSNLDATLRERTRRELRALMKDIGITAVYVTHDQEEAFDLSDRIAVMRDGRLEQVGPAEELYHGPATPFVATFLGRAGTVDIVVDEGGSDGVVRCRLPRSEVVWPALAPSQAMGLRAGARARLLARPEALRLTDPHAEGALPGRLRDRRFAGSFYRYTVDVEGGWLEVQAGDEQVAAGDAVGIAPRSAPTGLFAFPDGE
jgi:ABC-type Fe3+/spermidine/putrescine transport system ATPase subunit